MERIHKLTDICYLESLKETIKNKVVDHRISWEERIDLYQKVQMINERINQIKITK